MTEILGCQHPRLKPDLSATTSVISIEFRFWGVICEDCGRKWDVGQVLQSVVDLAAALTQRDALEKVRVAGQMYVDAFGADADSRRTTRVLLIDALADARAHWTGSATDIKMHPKALTSIAIAAALQQRDALAEAGKTLLVIVSRQLHKMRAERDPDALVLTNALADMHAALARLREET